MIDLADGAVALMHAGFNVEFIEKLAITLDVLAVKNNHEITIPVDNSGLKFNSCEQLVKYCDAKVAKASQQWFDVFRDEHNLFA